jgi:predicted RNase H-like HicB family nuclease
MQFEVEVYRNETGEWIAEAVEYNVTAKGLTEKEALARVMEALTHHFKTSGRSPSSRA